MSRTVQPTQSVGLAQSSWDTPRRSASSAAYACAASSSAAGPGVMRGRVLVSNGCWLIVFAFREPTVASLAATCLRNMSTTSSMRRTHRSPSGSLAICWATSPAESAVHRSTSSALVTPARARKAPARSKLARLAP